MARSIVKVSRISEIDVINAIESKSFRDMLGVEIDLVGAAVTEDVQNGKTETRAYLFAADGEVYGGISDTVCGSVSMLIDYMNKMSGVGFKASVSEKLSRNGRNFLTVTFREVH